MQKTRMKYEFLIDIVILFDAVTGSQMPVASSKLPITKFMHKAES